MDEKDVKKWSLSYSPIQEETKRIDVLMHVVTWEAVDLFHAGL